VAKSIRFSAANAKRGGDHRVWVVAFTGKNFGIGLLHIQALSRRMKGKTTSKNYGTQ